MTELDRSAARDLLREVVATRSVSGNEGAVAERLREFFDSHDRAAWIDEVGTLRAPADDAVLLTSHMDTVPGEIPVEIEDGVLHGRGSVDAKGPLVALAVAAVRTGVSFAGVVEEETTSAGAKHLVAERDPPAAVINGEPSGWDAITLGYRGLAACEYTVRTEVGHTSRPEPNAIQRAIKWWNDVEAAFETEAGSTVDSVTPKPVAIEGGTTADGFEFEASVDAQFRVPPGESVAAVRETVADVGNGHLEWTEGIEPVVGSPRNSVATALRRGIRNLDGDPSHLRKTGTSDMNVFAEAWDIPMATYGPGDSALDHTPEEHIDLAAFDRAVEVLHEASESLRDRGE
jgi:LysW-gamma-L-lysine carboxypeptidase